MPTARTRAWLVRIGRVLLVAVLSWLALRLIRGIDWDKVLSAITDLAWWQAVVLVLAGVLRLAVLSGVLFVLIETLRYPQALANESAGAAVSTIAPDPSDVVVRLAMFRSWRIETTSATSGLTLRILGFYVVRLAVPVLGFVLFWIAREYSSGFSWLALVGGTGALLLLGGLVLALRAAKSAAFVGSTLGKVVGGLRPAGGGPEIWSGRVVEFQSHSADRVRRHGATAALVLLLYVLVETGVLITCLSFAGVRIDPGIVLVLGCSFLVVYPMNGLPMMGLGVLDAAYIAFVTDYSDLDPTDLLGGMIVWRLTVQVLPVLLGLTTLAWWRRTTGASAESA
ncbi:lysylphosphatidylglycerol synthase-like protein [Kribbella amoyensis]|uniref:Lysylphosphatidylglycerol synthase-like protein n=1 Tax=Kribbella amoyensis TaxID=996641 RepID=A0A561BYT6_9ACTN|nr:lysylphosphatidylglycerol synthase-like protein [Kribbella amoyensis]